MHRSLRILHVPGRTPYARKLRGPNFAIINETNINGTVIPRDASFEWIAAQSSFDFFDVLHMQSLELTQTRSIKKVLERSAAERKGIVLTIHELTPLFPDDKDDFENRIRLACDYSGRVVTLTKRAANEIPKLFGADAAKVTVIPHGSVLPTSHPLWKQKTHRNRTFTLGMFGGVRPNRSFLTACVNALYGLDSPKVRVKVLSRGMNPIELVHGSEALDLASLAASDKRLSLKLLPFPSDDEVANFVDSLDVLALPYLYGTHSGQLELAMDLGVAFIAPDIGCYRDQFQLHPNLKSKPFWFEYNPHQPYSYAAPLLRAIRAAYEHWRRRKEGTARSSFLSVRRREHDQIVRAHADLYAASIPT